MTAGCNFACYKSNLQSFTFHAPTPSNPHPPYPEPALSRFFPLFIFFCLLRMCVSHSKKIPEEKKQSFSSRPAEIRFMKEINILKKKKNPPHFHHCSHSSSPPESQSIFTVILCGRSCIACPPLHLTVQDSPCRRSPAKHTDAGAFMQIHPTLKSE